jgi:hypothetical protein
MRGLLLGSVALAALSALAVPAASSYDPLAWLLWGRELAAGSLDTAEGPAFKPLPVVVCTLLAPLGDAAPLAWVTIARAGALAAAGLAFILARRLAGGSLLAGVAGAAGVVFAGRLTAEAASGAAEGLLVAGALGALLAWHSQRPRLALALATGCALVRVEALPFLAAACLMYARRPGADRWSPALALGSVPLLWLGPELVASGELWRSGERARAVLPGQPALADVPALESVRRAAGLALAPVVLGTAALLRRPRANAEALLPAAAGAAWVAVVAAMAQLGFSGEERYATPGIAAVSVSGGAGLALAARRLGALARPASRPVSAAPAATLVAAVALASAPRAAELARLPDVLRYQARLSGDLERAVALAGGRERVLACGRPYVGRFRGPLLAYRLGVVKRRVDFSPRGSGVVFASRLGPGRPWEPAVGSAYRALARAGTWRVLAACGPGDPPETRARFED